MRLTEYGRNPQKRKAYVQQSDLLLVRLREPGYARTRTSRRCGSDARFVSHSPREASSTIFRASNIEASASTLRSKSPPSRSYQGWELSKMRRSCTKTSGSASLHATCASPAEAFV